MTDDEKIILDHLKALRQGLTKIQGHFRDHDKRFSLIERQLAGARGDIAAILALRTTAKGRP